MSLAILQVAYPLLPVSGDAVGGAEQVVARLDAGLAAAGHRPTLLASEGSRAARRLVATPAVPPPFDDAAKAAASARQRAALAALLARESFDLVHMHGLDFPAVLPPPGVPVLATLHLPPAWYPPEALAPARPATLLSCVSEAQRAAAPPGAAIAATIPNGVEAPAGPFPARRGFALALGRVCPEKGLEHGLDAARAAEVPLLLAGAVHPFAAHERYFAEEIRPRLDRCRRFLGPVGGARKRRLLAAARCLLVPSLVAETSSLVAMEALAAGTPVIAYPAGALPEIVEDGRTGFIVRDAAGMARAIGRADRLDPAACREAAARRFPAACMIAGYVSLYRRILGSGPCPETS